MKFQYRAALSCALFVATLPMAQAEIPVEFSGEVALTTDYVFRGISFSDENFAIQGEFDATHSSGAYIGVWASNISGLPEGGSVELDVYAGYAGKINNFGYDVFVTRFIFPGTGEDDTTGKNHHYFDFHEYTLALSYSLPVGTEFGVRYDYAPNWYGNSTGFANNYLLNVSHPLPNGFSVGASLGRQDFSQDLTNHPDVGYNDYTYYGAQVAYTYKDFTLALDFIDTNARDANGSSVDGTEERVVFTLTKTF